MEQSVEEQMEQLLFGISQWYDGTQKLPKLLLYEKELHELLRLGSSGKKNGRLTVISGRSGSGRKLLLMTAAQRFQKGMLLINGSDFLKLYLQYGRHITSFLVWEAAQRNCLFCFIDCQIPEESENEWTQMLLHLLLQKSSFWMVLETVAPLPMNGDYEYTAIELKEPDARSRAVLWSYFLEEAEEAKTLDPDRLGSCYHFHSGEIRQVLRSAILGRIRDGRNTLCEDDIRKAAQLWGSGNLSPLAVKVPCAFSWNDLILDEGAMGQLHELCNLIYYQGQVGTQWGFYEKRPYGKGLCALFYGSPGTGKTMAAQVVARELGMELYRVDLSQMNSKYIGETQKNLHRLFENAKEMNVILFFDEADALFSKRTSVKDANDRHANGEVAYLLQRLEAYEGITILATNLKNQLDDAFRRRIRRMIHFQLPDYDTRKRMWEQAFPAQAPLESEVDFSVYARRFELSAGEIKDAAMDAAFLAAAQGTRIGHQQIRKALKLCYEKYGRVLTDEDF